MCLPAERGAGGGLFGARLLAPGRPAGHRPQAFTAIVSASAFTAELFVLAVAEFVTQLAQPTVLVIDNASIHKAHLVNAQVAAWAAAGLTPLFLPPFSPELNRIEIL